MAESTRTDDLPRDRDLERVVLGAAIHSAGGYYIAATIVAEDDFWFMQHRRLWRACAMEEVGPFLTNDLDAIVALSPMTLPSSRHVRDAAIATLADDVPMWAVRALAELAPAVLSIEPWARRLRELGDRRRRLLALEREREALVCQ